MTVSLDIRHRAASLTRDHQELALPRPAASPEEAPLDPRDLAHAVVEGLFGLVFPDPHARLRLGLKAVSRAAQESMSWYVWTTQRAGAIEVALLPGSPEAHPDGALLALRYFPDPGESLFASFAPVEQQARLSPLFDRTGTPGMDSAENLDPSLFHVGTLVIVPQGANHIGLQLSAQDRWIEQERGDGGWRTRRDVPGLELALALFDPLVCALSYLGRRPPALVRAWRRPGIAWRIKANGQAYSRHDPSTSAWEIEHHGLVAPGRAGSAGSAPLPTRADEQPLFEHAAEIPPHYAPWPVNPQWWQAAGWQFDPVGVFCAHCAAEEDGHRHPHQAFSRRIDDEHNS